ncbi:MAG: DegT/DnrJ/EryC1/StrS family aminotransferase [Alphaproteobacteria bacterium]|nr:MAG: DegT/DnrJ/EryC1/StrS family aminotransferase [Alphaproteobacteria bacterium]
MAPDAPTTPAAASHAGAVDTSPVPFIDLITQRQRIWPQVLARWERLTANAQFILGPEVAELERQLAEAAGTRHALAVASGTDALLMPLMAKGVGPGDAVLCPSFTFAATPEVVARLGATPVFVDVRAEDFNIDPAGIEPALVAARTAGLRPVAIMPVDLFGQAADYGAVNRLAQQHGLWVLADAAQSFGARVDNRAVGSLAEVTATSFYPAKSLGAWGDGGALFTDDEALYQVLKSIRVHGEGTDRYDNVRLGITGRLDALQASVLIEKLAIFPEEIEARNAVAARYSALLAGHVAVPRLHPGNTSVWAQYTVILPAGTDRGAVQARMKAAGVPSMIYYPKPNHLQAPYAAAPQQPGGLPVTIDLAARVLSLPMHPYLTEAQQQRVADSLIQALDA